MQKVFKTFTRPPPSIPFLFPLKLFAPDVKISIILVVKSNQRFVFIQSVHIKPNLVIQILTSTRSRATHYAKLDRCKLQSKNKLGGYGQIKY